MHSLLALLLFILTTGCVKNDSIRYVTLPPKPVEQVELLPGPPDRPYKVIGSVFIQGKPAASWQYVAEAAREEAASIGADAVFMGQAGEFEAGSLSMPTGSTTTTSGTIAGSSMNRLPPICTAIQLAVRLSLLGLETSSSLALRLYISIHDPLS